MRETAGVTVSGGFWRHERGNAAIEFAIIAPLLLLMLLGTVELGRAVNTNRHFAAAVASTGDLVAREVYMGKDSAAAQNNLADMMKSIEHLMRPYDPTKLQLAIYSVMASPTDESKGKVEWVYSYRKADALAKCASYSLPGKIVPKGGSVIVVDANYNFNSLFGTYVPGMQSQIKWSDKSYHSPRNSCVDYLEGDNCLSHC